MSAALTLPGTIPGLLRRGSPVLTVKHAGTGLFRADFAGVVFDLQSPVVDERSAPLDRRGPPDAVLASFPGGPPFWANIKYLALDLTDATGRAHAVWWLAGKVFAAPDAQPELTVFRRRGNGWELMAYDDAHHPQSWTHVDLDLDPSDPRRLPDGSRWVDAEALRRVCLHAAGLS